MKAEITADSSNFNIPTEYLIKPKPHTLHNFPNNIAESKDKKDNWMEYWFITINKCIKEE